MKSVKMVSLNSVGSRRTFSRTKCHHFGAKRKRIFLRNEIVFAGAYFNFGLLPISVEDIFVVSVVVVGVGVAAAAAAAAGFFRCWSCCGFLLWWLRRWF